MKDDINQDITFRKLAVFMMFMTKGNIARTAEAMQLSGVSVHRALHTLEEGGAARCLSIRDATCCRCRRPGRCWSIVRTSPP